MSARALVAVAGALLVVLSVWTFLRADERAAPAGAPGPADAALVEELRSLRLAQERTVAALERVADELATRAPAPSAPARSDVGAGVPAEDVVAALDALHAALEAHRVEMMASALGRIGGSGAESADSVRRRVGRRGWSPWVPFVERWRQDDDATKRSMQLRPMQDVLAEFGEPDRVTWYGGVMKFLYSEPEPADGSRRGADVTLTIHDGIVVDVNTELYGE